MTGILDIHHLMLGVADPDAAAADFSRFGFTATPLSGMPQIGLANRCVLLPAHVAPKGEPVLREGTCANNKPRRANYLELLGHDAACASPLMRALPPVP